jgi:hypothetical protein
VDFSNQQTELIMAAQREELMEKSKTVQQQMYTKLEELHNAYKKARSSVLHASDVSPRSL